VNRPEIQDTQGILSNKKNMAWYNAAWKTRKKITIDYTKVGASVTNFPVYVNLANMGSDFFAKVQNGGADIRVTDEDGTTELPREVVTCVTGEVTSGELWFKAGAPSNATNTSYYIYYNNAAATEPAVSDTYGRNAVWSNGFLAVYHLATDSYISSTGSNNGTNSGSTNTTGEIGVGKAFSGTAQAIALNNMSLSPTTLTYSAWATHGTLVNWAKIISKTLTTAISPYSSFNLCVDNSANKLLRAEIAVGATQYVANSTTVLPTGWTYCAATYDNANIRVWLNAVNEGTTACTGDRYGSSDPMQIGRAYFGGAVGEYWTGNIDEARVANATRNQAWFTTEYNNQNSPSTFYTIGVEETFLIPSIRFL
jgi:biopolymer transport protein ExbB